ncbi:pre-mRNA-splicing factor CWC22 homolog [Octopus sinensis]|uniref:Pre-mRNA-splicing factor CWC22 homolog n=1 Tax=Octopus sinensis TaxID=2607531 RepID=A0A6P7TGN3_9MOLL|nr:pre-mRNA-splicing factor CWC22 homolog [Octopus sinensis]XP_036367967.1 pre-mRNA-splicing factor CWC22 homolog [Octopus sinensis]
MSLSEFTERQQNGDLDLYDDILREDFECEKDSINELQQKYQEAMQKIATLENTVKERTSAMEILEEKNTNLQKNILNLYKTACLTIKGKSGNIISLREKIEFYEKEKCLKQMQSGYSHWNSHHQRHKPPQRDQRDTKENDRRHSRHSDVKNPRYFDSKSNSHHSGSKEQRHDDRRYEEKHSSRRDLQKPETKDNGSLEKKSSRHSKTRNNFSDIKMENSSREHKKDSSKHHYQKTPSSTQKLSSRSENRKSHTTPLKEKCNLSNNSSESGSAKRQDSKLIDCQQSVEPISISAKQSVKSTESDAQSSKSSTGKFSSNDKHRSKMCDPVVTSPKLTTKCDRNHSPVISPKYKASKVFNSPEPIVVRCFGMSNLEVSHSPIIIPCYSSSATNSGAHDSTSSEDSDSNAAVPRSKTIVRKLFSPSKTECNLSVENLVPGDKLAENHSLEFLNEMKKKLSQEIAAHNRRQQDEDCEDTTQLVDIYQTRDEEYCSNDSLREDQNSLKTFSPQPQSDLHAVTEQSETECVDLEKGEIVSDDDKKKDQTSSYKISSSQIRVSSHSKKHLSKHSTKHGSKHSSRKHSKKRKFSEDETLTKIKNKHNNSSSRTENKRRREIR